jgi:F-type H+-transporting ATPase subunit epsilon
MTLKIISTTEVLFEGTTDSVTLPGELGRFTVLNNHASLISTLVEGDITYHTSESTVETFHVKGGMVDVDRNTVSVCIY